MGNKASSTPQKEQQFLDSKPAKCIRSIYEKEGKNYFDQLCEAIALNEDYCRSYCVEGFDEGNGYKRTFFREPIFYSGEPYYCPTGWIRWAVDLELTPEEFDEKYGEWPVAYHGTHPQSSISILQNGFHHSSDENKCHLPESDDNARGIYFSPSIEYAGHPRYADIFVGQGRYVQLVLQVRLKPSLITHRGCGTLDGARSTDKRVDPNFSNDELEWVVRWDSEENLTMEDGAVIYGFMMRITDKDPRKLPKNAWWGKK